MTEDKLFFIEGRLQKFDYIPKGLLDNLTPTLFTDA